MTNEEVLKLFDEEILLRGLSPYTRSHYLGNIKRFLKFAGDVRLDEVTEKEIRAFLLYKFAKGNSPGSVNTANAALRFLLGSVLQKNINARMLPRRRVRRKIPKLMSQRELTLFFQAIDNLRDRAMMMTIYGGGLRRSEIINLRIQDIDSKEMRIFIKESKCGKSRYTILSQRNLAVLREYFSVVKPFHPDGYLFLSRNGHCRTLTTRAVENIFHKYLKKAGITTQYTLHSLRHCFATHSLKNGIDPFKIKEMLGHTDLRTTAFYMHMVWDRSVVSPLDILGDHND